jgi:TolB-like protein/Tfp pilus assembly protein PilF
VIALGLVARAVFTGPSVTIRSIAVLPLENLTGDVGQDYFTDGMTDALTTTLAQIESLRVISRTSAMRYRDSRKAVPEIARELDVDAVVAGSVARSGDRVRINAQLIEASGDRHLWVESYERAIGDVLALQGEMARTIASEIELRLTPQQEGWLQNPRPVTPQAYEAYLKGRFFWNKRNKEAIEKSIDYYTEAIRLDPGYAPAYAGLAEAYTIMSCGAPAGLPSREAAPKARSAAVKAVELDDGSAEAHAALGFQENCYGDVAAAEREYRRAIALNRNYAAAHHWYALLLLGWRDPEALEHVKEALRLDPVSPNINGLLGNVLMNLRRFDEAVEQLRQTVELDPQQYNSRMRLGFAYAVTGRYVEAEREFNAADAISPGTVYTLGARAYLSGLQGNKATAESLLPELEAKAPEASHPWLVSLALIGLGRKDEAIEWLEKAYDQGDFYFDLMNPVVDSLRAERRFKDLERRVQLARQAHALR